MAVAHRGAKQYNINLFSTHFVALVIITIPVCSLCAAAIEILNA